MNTEEYVHTMTWLQALTGLLEQMQVRPPGGALKQKKRGHSQPIFKQSQPILLCKLMRFREKFESKKWPILKLATISNI